VGKYGIGMPGNKSFDLGPGLLIAGVGPSWPYLFAIHADWQQSLQRCLNFGQNPGIQRYAQQYKYRAAEEYKTNEQLPDNGQIFCKGIGDNEITAQKQDRQKTAYFQGVVYKLPVIFTNEWDGGKQMFLFKDADEEKDGAGKNNYYARTGIPVCIMPEHG